MITGKLFQNEFVCQANIITWCLLINEYVVLNVHDPDPDFLNLLNFCAAIKVSILLKNCVDAL